MTPPLWHVLLALLLFSVVGTWALTRVLPHEVEEAPITADDLITDAAVEVLLASVEGRYGSRYRGCPGCALEVHLDEVGEHGRICRLLRDLVLQPQ